MIQPTATAGPLAVGRFSHTGADSRPGSDSLVASAIVRVKEGDTSALHYLYLRFASDVRGYVQSIVRDPHDADDITQTVFTKLASAIRTYEQRDVPFEGWILRVARNAALDHLRTQRYVPCEEVRAGGAVYEPLGFDRSQCLREALERLPMDQREVLVLRHIAGLSPSEIAERLNKTEGSVHGLHHRGRGALRAALEELEAGPVIASA